jgi:hypothetical protein
LFYSGMNGRDNEACQLKDPPSGLLQGFALQNVSPTPIGGKSYSTADNLLTTAPQKTGRLLEKTARHKTMDIAAEKTFGTVARSEERQSPRPKRPQPEGFRPKTPPTSVFSVTGP